MEQLLIGITMLVALALPPAQDVRTPRITQSPQTTTDLQREHDQRRKERDQEQKEQAQEVRVTQNPQATAGCKFLGEVSVNGGLFRNSEKKLQKQAAEMGADLVFIGPNTDNGSERMFGTGHGAARGEAYRCEQPRENIK